MNRTALESLIKAGALDCFPGNRAQKLAVIGELVESAQASARNNLAGQLSLFAMPGDDGAIGGIRIERRLPPAADYSRQDLLQMEKDMLGIYLTGHPLNDVKERIMELTDMDTRRLYDKEDDTVRDGMTVTIAGIISARKNMVTKKGQNMAFLTVEDLYDSLEAVVFPKTYEKCRDSLDVDNIVLLTGKLDLKDEDDPKILADNVMLLADVPQNAAKATSEPKAALLKIVIPASYTEEEGLAAFRDIAKAHLGEMPVAILVMATGHKYRLSYDLWVEPDEAFCAEVRRAFGQDCIRA
jgi:DNA polymerase-3 subunit alpha